MLLRNQDRYLDILHVNVARDSRERREAVDKNIPCDGFFFEHENNLFALGAEAGEIYVILNGKLLKHDDNTLQYFHSDSSFPHALPRHLHTNQSKRVDTE